MLPEHKLKESLEPIILLPPDDEDRNLLQDFEMGGVSIGDASMGLLYQYWKAWYDNETVYVSNSPFNNPISLFSIQGLTQISLSFDQNMRPHIAYVANGVAGLWWYDTVAGQHSHMTLPNIRSPFLTLDDKRPEFVISSDILLFYIKDSAVWYRQQRDRFLIERKLVDISPYSRRIIKCGMGLNNRIQLEII